MSEFQGVVREVRLKSGGSVEVLRPQNAADIPAQLRAVARDIESGALDVTQMVAFIEMPEGVQAYAWGNYDRYRAIGIAQIGAKMMMEDAE